MSVASAASAASAMSATEVQPHQSSSKRSQRGSAKGCDEVRQSEARCKITVGGAPQASPTHMAMLCAQPGPLADDRPGNAG